MMKIILAGCLGICVGWVATTYHWKSRCLIQNVKFNGGISLADGNAGCAILNNNFDFSSGGLFKIAPETSPL